VVVWERKKERPRVVPLLVVREMDEVVRTGVSWGLLLKLA